MADIKVCKHCRVKVLPMHTSCQNRGCEHFRQDGSVEIISENLLREMWSQEPPSAYEVNQGMEDGLDPKAYHISR